MFATPLMDFIGFLGMAVIVALGLLLVSKMKLINQLKNQTAKLRIALDETDEQAKLIVRTDIELNRTQEELDRKITSLYALHRLSRAISTTLDEAQIFKKINSSVLEEFGFEKAAIFLWSEKQENFQLSLALGYTPDEAELITSLVNTQKNFYLNLIGNERSVSSISPANDQEIKNTLAQQFNIAHFVICPLLPKEDAKGIILVGAESSETPVTEGDEEVITIFANQLSQALENARLFEKIWQAQQGLENKIRERTAELTTTLNELNALNKRKNEFVSNVSHELRTPLTSIKGYASILLAGKLGSLPEEARLRLEKINHHSDELVQFINDLLDIARIESGRTMMKIASEDLKALAEEVIDILSVQAREKRINLSYDIAEDAKNALVDPGQIKRVLINLINNALKFTPENGSIKVTARRHDSSLQVDISDTGCGIPPEAQERIFEEFYRVDNPINQQVKGTGLGLVLVKNIIEAHKGKIWVKSNPGSGSTFSFTLPLA
jgi:signal transduction histidine kinase/Na+-transporting methylmalonyl-CoA/oxaloacetate decarboxylase gamma subunit